MFSLVYLVIVLGALGAVLLAAGVLTARALDRRAGRRTATVLDAIGGLRAQLAEPRAPSPRAHVDGHCRGAECFQGIDVCACPCVKCVEEREALLREQGEM
jgi:hypothetical protein